MSTKTAPLAVASRLDPYDDEIDVRVYLILLWRRRWIIAACTLVCGLIAVAVNRLTPPIYEATARLVVSDPVPAETSGRYRALLADPALARLVAEDLGRQAPPYQVTPVQIQSALAWGVDPRPDVMLIVARMPRADLAARTAASAARQVVDLARKQDEAAADAARGIGQAELREAERLLAKAKAAHLAFEQRTQVDGIREDTATAALQRRELLKVLADVHAHKALVKEAEAQLARLPRTLNLKRATGSDRETVDEVMNPAYDVVSRDLTSARLSLASLEAKRDYLRDIRKLRLDRGAGPEATLGGLENDVNRLQRLRDQLADTVGMEEVMRAVGRPTHLKYLDEVALSDQRGGSRPARDLAIGLAAGLFLSVIGVLASAGLRNAVSS